APVQAGVAEEIAILQARSGESPMTRVQRAERRARHDTRFGEDHAEKSGFRLDPRVEAAFEGATLHRTGVAVLVDRHRTRELDLAVEAIATQVHQSSAMLVNPRLDGAVHRSRPVFRMG